jgi:hypothetical protein
METKMKLTLILSALAAVFATSSMSFAQGIIGPPYAYEQAGNSGQFGKSDYALVPRQGHVVHRHSTKLASRDGSVLR